MPPKYDDDMIITTVHDFKTNFSKYMRMLNQGFFRAVFVEKYGKTMGVYMSANRSRLRKRDDG